MAKRRSVLMEVVAYLGGRAIKASQVIELPEHRYKIFLWKAGHRRTVAVFQRDRRWIGWRVEYFGLKRTSMFYQKTLGGQSVNALPVKKAA